MRHPFLDILAQRVLILDGAMGTSILRYRPQAADWGGDHLVKVGTQFAQMGMNDQFWVNGDMHILFNNTAANAVRLWNTPTAHNSKIRLFGIFAQDTWSYKQLTLNVGVRIDHSRGWMPAQSKAAGTFSAARDLAETDAAVLQEVDVRGGEAAVGVEGHRRRALLVA